MPKTASMLRQDQPAEISEKTDPHLSLEFQMLDKQNVLRALRSQGQPGASPMYVALDFWVSFNATALDALQEGQASGPKGRGAAGTPHNIALARARAAVMLSPQQVREMPGVICQAFGSWSYTGIADPASCLNGLPDVAKHISSLPLFNKADTDLLCSLLSPRSRRPPQSMQQRQAPVRRARHPLQHRKPLHSHSRRRAHKAPPGRHRQHQSRQQQSQRSIPCPATLRMQQLHTTSNHLQPSSPQQHLGKMNRGSPKQLMAQLRPLCPSLPASCPLSLRRLLP